MCVCVCVRVWNRKRHVNMIIPHVIEPEEWSAWIYVQYKEIC